MNNFVDVYFSSCCLRLHTLILLRVYVQSLFTRPLIKWEAQSTLFQYVYSPNGISSINKREQWTPEGRRVLTGSTSGEFTLWNGLTFNFETILQAHDAPIRTFEYSHSGTYLASGDQSGMVKYFLGNMNNVWSFQVCQIGFHYRKIDNVMTGACPRTSSPRPQLFPERWKICHL